MEDLKRQPNENRSDWGWRLLMHDLRNPKGTLPPQSEQEVKETAGVTNIINNYSQSVPQTMGRFHFASVYAIIVTIIIFTIAGLLLWKVGFIDYLLGWIP